MGIYLGKPLFGKPRIDRKDNIKIALRDTGCDDGRWMELS